MLEKIAITALSSLSPLGQSPKEIWESYSMGETLIARHSIGSSSVLAAALPQHLKEQADALKASEAKYRPLDNSVLYAILASRKAVQSAGWGKEDGFGINMGSSRGAAQLFENHFKEFLETGKAPTLASPSTTLGNISSWIAHDLNSSGPEISHSITCSTALHAVLNAAAWLRSGMASKFLAGGSEAPLTPFTVAQMKALKIYSDSTEKYPCRAFDLDKKQNSMVLGEGASAACLELGEHENALAYIEGIGFATEVLEHSISISAEADCFQKSMKMALQGIRPEEVDAVVMHAPGTLKGDLSELRAIQIIFGENLPMLTTNKWKIGHTFGASGMLSIELAILMMRHQKFIAVPYAKAQKEKKEIAKVLVNAVGFGGNAVSILISRA
ncbi:MAG TPA: beta-ketoacyl synthase N-terminal-like domain-containing protein [Flavobacterium sp.]|nr:beta-ketoacyl synthase N-terminal-like domain-containing protein [Flavobacterium sp.]